MIDLAYKSRDELIIDDEVYPLDLSFDNVIRLLDMIKDESIAEAVKSHFGLKMLTGKDFSDFNILEASEIFMAIFDEHIQIKKEEKIQYDLKGNPMKKQPQKEQKKLYSLNYDSDFVFSGFMQAYGIDLIEQQGKLHWMKFNALLSGLPDDTKFADILRIRAWEPQSRESEKEKERMKKLQKEYELPDDS